MASRMLIVFLFLLAGSAAAQIEAGTSVRMVRVQVAFANGGCDAGTHVTLLERGRPVAETTANERCEAAFFNVPAGTYRLRVSGQAITETESGAVEMTPSGSTDFEVKVKRASDVEGNGTSGSASVSAADLSIPLRARKEFDKANELIAKQDFGKARDRLNKAIAIYPAYASAYNSLAVIYARQGDRAREREALQKAVSINDHFAPAYVNLGRMYIATSDFASAETTLNKAASYDPTDAMTFVLLTYCDFMDQHIDEAIANSRKAHTLEGPHAFAHQVAARAFEQKHDQANAVAELELFLQEEPSGQRADIARKELAALRAIHQ